MKSSKIAARIALTAVLGIFCAPVVHSEECYRISSVDTQNTNVSLRYLSQTDSTSLVYCIFNLPEEASDEVLFNVSRKLYVTDGEINYGLIAAHNVPVEDESVLEYCILEGKDRKLNFILEFEKFPADEKFDIVDDSSRDNGLNFQGICVDMSSPKTVDAGRFMKSTALPRCGQYYDDGKCYSYYERDGVFVSCRSSYGDDNLMLYLSLVNNSDHGILFNTKNMTVTGHKLKKKDSVEVNLPILSKNDYVSLVANTDVYEAEMQNGSQGLSEVGSAISFASIGLPFRSLEYSGLQALGGFVRDVNRNSIKPYLAELDRTRGERTKNYLQSQSIKPGESHSGFLRVERPKNVNDWLVSLHMDDYNFEFYYRIKK